MTGLFGTFSVDFAGSLSPGSNSEKNLLIAVEHFTGWPIVRVMKRETSDVVLSLVEEEVFHLVLPGTSYPTMLVA